MIPPEPAQSRACTDPTHIHGGASSDAGSDPDCTPACRVPDDCPHDLVQAPSWAAGWGEITWQCGLCGAEATAQIDMDAVKWGAPNGT